MTKQGRIAVLTNFRDEGAEIIGERSRGEIVKNFLTAPPDSTESPADYAQRLLDGEGVKGVGGFSLVFGQLVRPGVTAGYPPPLGIISNRTPDVHGVVWIADEPGQTHALSNSHYGDRGWPKVVQGEELLARAIREAVERGSTLEEIVEAGFDILSTDALPERRPEERWDVMVKELRKSIFIRAIGDAESEGAGHADRIAAARTGAEVGAGVRAGVYGTRQQTVVVLDKDENLHFIERTLYDDNARPVDAARNEKRFTINLQN